MRDAATVAIIVGEFLGTFGLAYLAEDRVLRWYLRHARKSRARVALVISATHVVTLFAGLMLIGFASAVSTHASSVVALLLALAYGALAATTLPGDAPLTICTADTARKLGARKLAETILRVGGAWSLLAMGLWFGAVLGGLSGLGLID